MSNYSVKPVVSDYGLHENGELKLICSSRNNALLIKSIMDKDDKYQSGFNGNPTFTLEDFNQFILLHDYDQNSVTAKDYDYGMSDQEHILLSAVRYALNRTNYIVPLICEYLTCNNCRLSLRFKDIATRDIQESIALSHRLGMACGDSVHEDIWNKLLNTLNNGGPHEH